LSGPFFGRGRTELIGYIAAVSAITDVDRKWRGKVVPVL